MDDNFDYKKELIYKAIEDTTSTIRFLDTKVGAVLLVIGLIATFLATIKDCIYETFMYFKPTFPFNCFFIVLLITLPCLIFVSILFGFLAVSAIGNPKNHVTLRSN